MVKAVLVVIPHSEPQDGRKKEEGYSNEENRLVEPLFSTRRYRNNDTKNATDQEPG